LEVAFGRFPSGPADTVLIESASCLSLSLLPPSLRDPEKASSFGLGLVLQEAFRRPTKCIILALGGVATVDGVVVAEAEVMCKLEDKPEKPPSEPSAS